ncbi:hypothetical protein Lfu02_17470 [Longispora fulva]|uniref:Putative phosphodiesterase n=1 Tax=Longispora fulva TaxID=619741 RepID=A0A8J7GM40_9ACTN|nr:metallophosphoesterase [Longispora fulva]MBG6140245.1 putative phosphodiesterase [Longispora fulva]GIG57375.1 hypothetical protein Lfu02_17470 [Longispora fulva]
MTKRIVIVSDTQIPYHHKPALRNVIRYIGESQPDRVIQIGDLADYPNPSRWNAGTRGEYAGSVKADSEVVKRDFLGPLREVYSGPVGVHEGNHDLRPREYLASRAPALDFSDAFNVEVLCDFDGFGIDRLPDFEEVAPGWLTTHGHLGFPLSRVAGVTALGGARKTGKSIVCGHTHRLGVTAESRGYSGRTEMLTGFEVGHLMDIKSPGAAYLKTGAGNWQMGFGLLEVTGTYVNPRPIYMSANGRFTIDSKDYR